MELKEAIEILGDKDQIIYVLTTGTFDEKWKRAYKYVINEIKDIINKQNAEE